MHSVPRERGYWQPRPSVASPEPREASNGGWRQLGPEPPRATTPQPHSPLQNAHPGVVGFLPGGEEPRRTAAAIFTVRQKEPSHNGTPSMRLMEGCEATILDSFEERNWGNLSKWCVGPCYHQSTPSIRPHPPGPQERPSEKMREASLGAAAQPGRAGPEA